MLNDLHCSYMNGSTDNDRRRVASWDGSGYKIRQILLVHQYTKSTIDAAGNFTRNGIRGCFDIEANEMIYVPYSATFTATFSTMLSHRLYDVAQRVDMERNALKQAFAECCANRLNRDVVEFVFRFC